MIQGRTVLALAAIAIVFLAFLPADPRPLAYGLDTKDTWGPNTVAEMQASADWLDRRLDDGDHVFSVMAEYHSLSDHYPPYSPRIYHTVSPQHGQLEGLNRTDYHDRMRARFVTDLRTGGLTALVLTRRTHYVLTRWPAAMAAFRANYCRVTPTPAVYRANGVNVYEYAPDRPRCANKTQFD